MAGLNLNSDILRETCGFITGVQYMLSFSRTCSQFHPIGVERRLSMQPLIIYFGKSLRRLYDFVFVDEERRSPHIRVIYVLYDPPLEALSEDLVDHFLALLKELSTAEGEAMNDAEELHYGKKQCMSELCYMAHALHDT